MVLEKDRMATALSLHFEAGVEPFPGCFVHRAHISSAFDDLYEVSLLLTSSDPAVDPNEVVGLRGEVWLEGEPYLERVPGIVRSVRQLTSLASATGHVASYYEVTLAPPLFLAGLRSGRRIHQDKNVVEIVTDTLRPYLADTDLPVAILTRALEKREYCVQYDETDLAFVLRVLSEDHLTCYFDVVRGGAFTIADNPATSTAPLPFRLPFVPPSNLLATGPAALSVRFEDGYASGAVLLRDYDFEHPQRTRSVPVGLAGAATVSAADLPFPSEPSLARELYEVGRFKDDTIANAIAKRDLAALRGMARVVECETNVAIFPGTRLFIDDHARPELLGELIAVGARIVIDDGTVVPRGDVAAGGADPTKWRRSCSLRCVLAARGYVPERIPKPRAIGNETAFVVGSLGDGHVDVDVHGRPTVELPWDRRDLRSGRPTRRVRVSQAWAGPNRGIVALPRIGDEVLLGYEEGDPDRPLIVGRVHNAVSRTPLDLPDPDSTVTAMKSRTIGGDGFNQLLMDDKPGGERLELRAEKTRTDLTQGDESATVGGSFSEDITGKASVHVHANTTVKLDAILDAKAGSTFANLQALSLDVDEAAIATAGGGWVISGPSIALIGDGASITIANGVVTIKGSAVNLVSGGGGESRGGSGGSSGGESGPKGGTGDGPPQGGGFTPGAGNLL